MQDGTRKLMLGNEAIAWGALAAGVEFVSGYPGTPSSEVMETLIAKAPEFGHYAEWSVNEKVAVECAAAAAWAGQRSMAVMKHLGLNVAADALTTLAYTGVRGGMVILSAGDAQCHTSSNELDARLFGRFANLPVLDPASPEEAFHFTQKAFEVSETLELPVILNSTPRLSHSSFALDVSACRPAAHRKAAFVEDRARWVCVAASALARHRWLTERLEDAAGLIAGFPAVERTGSGRRLGVVTNGVAHSYVLEAIDELGVKDRLSVLKLAFSYPFPDKDVCAFAETVDELLVVEELEPFVEDQLRVALQKAGIAKRVRGKNEHLLPLAGELDPSLVGRALAAVLGMKYKEGSAAAISLPVRPPVFCPGCPHRSTYYGLRLAVSRLPRKPLVVGDIGCYTLVNFYPFEMLDTLLCMGAGAGMAHGFAHTGIDRPILAIMGDSTFFHSGLPPLANIAYHGSRVTVLLLDNRFTAMTGFQPNPGTGVGSSGQPARRLSLEAVARSLGFDHLTRVTAHDPRAVADALVRAFECNGPAMVISEAPCALQEQRLRSKSGEARSGPLAVQSETCVGCRACVAEFGCSAIGWSASERKACIDPARCVGCGDCASVCPVGAIGGQTRA